MGISIPKARGHWVCAFCKARGVTLAGADTHVRKRHPEQYEQARHNASILIFDWSN